MKTLLTIASLSGFIGVALGALGAHKVKQMVSPEMLDIYMKGVQYQLVHTLALLAIALMIKLLPNMGGLRYAGWFMLAGIALFSFSLYIYSLSGIKIFAHITPFGGLCFLTGWAILFFNSLKLADNL